MSGSDNVFRLAYSRNPEYDIIGTMPDFTRLGTAVDRYLHNELCNTNWFLLILRERSIQGVHVDVGIAGDRDEIGTPAKVPLGGGSIKSQ